MRARIDKPGALLGFLGKCFHILLVFKYDLDREGRSPLDRISDEGVCRSFALPPGDRTLPRPNRVKKSRAIGDFSRRDPPSGRRPSRCAKKEGNPVVSPLPREKSLGAFFSL